jgi:hypothetical protein
MGVLCISAHVLHAANHVRRHDDLDNESEPVRECAAQRPPTDCAPGQLTHLIECRHSLLILRSILDMKRTMRPQGCR